MGDSPSPRVAARMGALRARFLRDREGEAEGRHGAVAARLESALDAIGWRSAGGSSSEEVAAVAVHILDRCVTGHRDVDSAVRSLAELLYQSSATLDGSMPDASAFVPAALEVIDRYIGPVAPAGESSGAQHD